MSRHPACGYDGPHSGPHPVVVVTGELVALIASGDYTTPCLREEICPGEPEPRAGTWCYTHGQQWPRCVDVSGLHQIEATP